MASPKTRTASRHQRGKQENLVFIVLYHSVYCTRGSWSPSGNNTNIVGRTTLCAYACSPLYIAVLCLGLPQSATALWTYHSQYKNYLSCSVYTMPPRWLTNPITNRTSSVCSHLWLVHKDGRLRGRQCFAFQDRHRRRTLWQRQAPEISRRLLHNYYSCRI